ncbi:MAG: DUF4258 domain-containing protein [Candidatus Kapabacteria bacterium]|nr:DUF4258 domain-containing protein [Candidatus Kapabacteria bacterium]
MDKLERPELNLTRERIENVLDDPENIIEKNETERHYLKRIPDFDSRWLRVIVNPQTEIIITAFFDRGVQ